MPDPVLDLTAVTAAVTEVKSTFEEYKKVVDERDKEKLTKGDADVLLEEKLARINTAIDEHQTSIDQFHAATKRKSVFIDGKPADSIDLDKKSTIWAQAIAKRRGSHLDSYTHEELAEYKTVFERYLRKDERVLSADELKALSAGSDPDGGYTVAPDRSGRTVMFARETSDMRAYANVQIISTDSLEGDFDLDEATTGWATETSTRSETDTPQIGRWRIPVHEIYAMPKATQRILDDSAIDIEAWLERKVADKMARTENTAFCTGDGSGKPRGFLTYADGSTIPGTMERFETGVDGDFAADPAGPDTLISMIQGLKAVYRSGANWFMNRTTVGGVRQLKDSNGNMLWQPSLQAGLPSTLLGYGIAEFDDMADYTTTDALAIAFGNMAETYQVVDRLGTRVIRDNVTSKPYTLFYTTRRVGGDVVNFEAMKLLEFTA